MPMVKRLFWSVGSLNAQCSARPDTMREVREYIHPSEIRPNAAAAMVMYALRAALLDIALGGCGLAGAHPSTESCASRLVSLSPAYGVASTFASGAFSERADMVDERGQARDADDGRGGHPPTI